MKSEEENLAESDYRAAQIAAIEELRQLFCNGAFLQSTVSSVEDFSEDKRICLTALSFVGEQVFSNHLGELIEKLKELEPWHYYYPAESLHLTVQNIRTISQPPDFNQNTIEKARAIFAESIPKFSSLNFELAGLLQMPTSVAIIALAEPSFFALTRELRQRLRDSGIPDNKHYIRDDIVFGNITFCRYTKPPTEAFKKLLELYSTRCLSQVISIDTVSLVSTNSVCDLKVTEIHGAYHFSKRTQN